MQPRIEGYSYDPLASHGQANCSGESRAKIARLIEWLTIGGGVPGCMHGGGSPDGAKLVIAAHTDITRNINLAKRLAQITEDISVEQKKKGQDFFTELLLR